MNTKVFKVFREEEWNLFQKEGRFAGSAHDLRDGFIHLSYIDQVEGVISRYFKQDSPIYIAEFNAAEFAANLKAEAAKSGELFPHLYEVPLLTSQVKSHQVRGD